MTSTESPCNIAPAIKAKAAELGFDACGFAHAAPVSTEAAKVFCTWLDEGKNDCMAWAENYRELRLDPTKLVPGAKTVISLAVNYLPQRLQPADVPQVARYAYGDDYHEVVRDMARQLAQFIKENTGHDSRICVDSAPILERYWAVQAGIGFIGLNTQLILPGRGSQFFLCELVTTLDLPADEPCTLTCGNCHACEKACPGGALSNGVLDAARCLSCQTIENHAEQLPEWVADAIGNRLYGCDECQKCCPHNRRATPTQNPAFQPRDAVKNISLASIDAMTQEQFSAAFRHSPIKRTKLQGLQRNAHLLKND